MHKNIFNTIITTQGSCSNTGEQNGAKGIGTKTQCGFLAAADSVPTSKAKLSLAPKKIESNLGDQIFLMLFVVGVSKRKGAFIQKGLATSMEWKALGPRHNMAF